MGKCFLFSVLFFFCFSGYAQSGLTAEYFDGSNFENKVLTRIDNKIDFNWSAAKGPTELLNPNNFSARWTGLLMAPKSGKYTFMAVVDDGIRVWIEGSPVINAWGMHDDEQFSGTFYMEAGRSYQIKVEYFNALLEGKIQLQWQLPGDEPVFKGLFGYNAKTIEANYFLLGQTPELTPPVAVKAPPKEAPKPVQTKKPVAKPAEPTVSTKPKPQKEKPLLPKTPQQDTIEKYTPKNILFVKSKSIMLAGSMSELDRLSTMLLRYPALLITIEGHTDNVGNIEKNQNLSEERAKAVADYLIEKGVSAARITWKGFGSSRPLVLDDSPEAHDKNRRVEFFIR